MSKVTKRPNPVDNPPSATFEVPTKWVKMIQRANPGDSVRVVIEGIVTSLDKQAVDSATFGFPGYLAVEMRLFRIQKSNSFYDDVIDDED